MGIVGRMRHWRKGHRIDCKEVGEVLQQYLDDELTDGRVELVAAHLEMCRRCGLEARTYADLKAALASRAAPEPESVDRLRDFGERLARGEVPDVEHDTT